MKSLGWLSEQAESQGNPAEVSNGVGDAGGISYGKYQFSSTMGIVQQFVTWLQTFEPPYNEYGNQLAQFEVNSEEFIQKWKELGTVDKEGFSMLQDKYTEPNYFGAGSDNLLEYYRFDISNKSFALKSVLFSNAVQHGAHYGAVIFKEAADSLGQDINEVSDEDFISKIYDIKLTDMSWSSGSPDNRPGLFDRWEREKLIALKMLENNETGE